MKKTRAPAQPTPHSHQFASWHEVRGLQHAQGPQHWCTAAPRAQLTRDGHPRASPQMTSQATSRSWTATKPPSTCDTRAVWLPLSSARSAWSAAIASAFAAVVMATEAGSEWGARGTVRLLKKCRHVARLVLLDLLLEYALQGLANEPLSCGRQLFRYFAAVNLNRFKFRTTANTFRGIVYEFSRGLLRSLLS